MLMHVFSVPVERRLAPESIVTRLLSQAKFSSFVSQRVNAQWP